MAEIEKTIEGVTNDTPGYFPEGEIENTGFFHQIGVLLGAFWRNPTRNAIIVTGLIILALIILISWGNYFYNQWYESFWDAVSRSNKDAFIFQLKIFLGIASVLVILTVAQTFFSQFFKMKLREGLTLDLITQWLKNKRAFRLTMAGEVGVDPDQRLHEDARHFAEASADLGIGVTNSIIMLITFVPVLWVVSEGFIFHVGDYQFVIPGYMVWAAVLYVGLATLLSWVVAPTLVSIHANRYAQEGALRSAFIRTNHSIDAVTLLNGEQDEERFLKGRLQNVLHAIWRIVITTTRLSGITSSYGWLANVAPYVIAAPLYFSGTISFGKLQASVQAFNIINDALRWFINNYGAIADWRATMWRVTTFRQTVVRMDDVDKVQKGRIVSTVNNNDDFTLDDFQVDSKRGVMSLSQKDVCIQPGGRLFIYADERLERTIFYEAMAGLWPWGEGRVGMPLSGSVAFMPERAYLMPGTLRGAILYALNGLKVDDATISHHLTAIGLGQFADALDREADWGKVLNEGQQQSLAVVRVILQNPRWIITNQIVDGLDEEARTRIMNMLMQYLPDAGVVFLSRKQEYASLFRNRVEVAFKENEVI